MKKDLNYIAGLEKAIEEKYGKDATKDPRSMLTEDDLENFKEQAKERARILRNRGEKEQTIEKAGFLIKKKLVNKTANRVCPVCDSYSFNIKDDVYMNKFEACYKCYVQYIEGREDNWEEKKKELKNAS